MLIIIPAYTWIQLRAHYLAQVGGRCAGLHQVRAVGRNFGASFTVAGTEATVTSNLSVCAFPLRNSSRYLSRLHDSKVATSRVKPREVYGALEAEVSRGSQGRT